jgi:quercetin dioxygenase-like cupin family protein
MSPGFTTLLARFVHKVISRREFSDRLLGLGFGAATVESVLDSVARADSQKQDSFQPYSAQTPYEQWMSREGVPVHTGYHIPNARALEVKPWARMGVRGALIDLEGAEGTDGAYILQIDPGGNTKPQRFLFEETIFVLDGEGETAVWQESGGKESFKWQKGSLFSPPLNIWRQHFNRGSVPARLVSFHDLPLILDVFHSAEFLFNNDFVFRDRYNNQPDYFTFSPSKLIGVGSQAMFNDGERAGVRMADTGLIPDVNKLELYDARSRGLKNRGIEMVFSDNTMQTHISEFEAGSYKRAHRHGPGYHIVILGGVGYSLMWTDLPQYSKAPKHMRVDWTEGSLFVPPDRWFHQHFNTGETAAKYMATSWIGGKFFAKALGGGGRTHRLNTVSVRKGGNMIDYPDEDPAVRSTFEEELRKHGIKSQMPSRRPG